MNRMPLVEDLMDRQFPTVRPDTRIKDAIDLLLDNNLVGVLVVGEEGELKGILSEKDCLQVIVRHGFFQLPDDFVEDFMHAPPTPVGSRTDILTVAQKFLDTHFRRLPVLDEGRLVGQITRRDIVRGMRKYR
jgi:CBS domain-containing protein